MAYVDHAFSISDEDIMMGTSYTINNKPPIKEIALAVSLLVFGFLGIIIGFFMAYNHVGGDTAHGNKHPHLFISFFLSFFFPFFPFGFSQKINKKVNFIILVKKKDVKFIIREF